MKIPIVIHILIVKLSPDHLYMVKILPITMQNGIEFMLGHYTIYMHGNSRTITIPSHLDFSAEAQVIVYQGSDHSGQSLYMRLIESEKGENIDAEAGRPPAVEKGLIEESLCHIGTIRNGSSCRMATVPSSVEEFGANTHVVLIGGQTTNGSRFLKVVLEEIWSSPQRQLVRTPDLTKATSLTV